MTSRAPDNASMSHLQAWDATLARVGARLWVRQRALVVELAARASAAFQRIGRTLEGASFGYLPTNLKAARFAQAPEHEFAQALLTALDASVELKTNTDRTPSTWWSLKTAP